MPHKLARELCIEQNKSIVLMKGTEAQQLVFFGNNRCIFGKVEHIITSAELQAKRNWYKESLVGPKRLWQPANIDTTLAQAPDGAIYQYIKDIGGDQNGWVPPPAATILDLGPRPDTTWILVEMTKNQYIMSPMLTSQLSDSRKFSALSPPASSVPSNVCHSPRTSCPGQDQARVHVRRGL
jgi:hypothetical protein